MEGIELRFKPTELAMLASALKVRVGPLQPNGNPFDILRNSKGISGIPKTNRFLRRLCDIQLR